MSSQPWYVPSDDEHFDRRVIRTLVTVLITVFSIWMIYRLRTPLLWLVISAFVAIAVSGPVGVLHRHMKRGLAIAIVYVSILLVPIMLGAILVPPLVNSGVDLVDRAPAFIQDFKRTIEKNEKFERLDANFNIEGQLTELQNNLADQIGTAAGVLSEIGQWLIQSLFAGFTIFILSIFLVARGKHWLDAFIRRRSGPEGVALERTFTRIGVSVSRYIGGALLQALLAGITAFIVLSILGTPSPLILAFIVAVFDLIPLVGATIAAVLVGIVTLFGSFPVDVVVWAIYAIGYQQVENYVIQPRIQSEAVNLEPFVVLLAVLFGGTLMGVVGAIISIPMAATIMIAIQEWGKFRAEVITIREDTGETDQLTADDLAGDDLTPEPS